MNIDNYLGVIALFGDMPENVEICLVGFFALGVQTGSFYHWRRDSCVTKDG